MLRAWHAHTFFMPLPVGPSIALDTACSSSLMALQNAYQAIRRGECPAAIVGGINVLLKPNTSVQFLKLGMLNPEGMCKSFDETGESSRHPEQGAPPHCPPVAAPSCTLQSASPGVPSPEQAASLQC